MKYCTSNNTEVLSDLVHLPNKWVSLESGESQLIQLI